MKQTEPIVDVPRDPEILIIALDCGRYATANKEKFIELRDVATRMARNRLLYGEGDNDLIGVFKLGSDVTQNRLADDNPGGYKGILCAFPAVRRCINAVRTVRELTASGKRVILLDVLETLGDYLSDFEDATAQRKRVVLFTHKSVVRKELTEDDRAQFIEVCDLYREAGVQLDAVCIDWEEDDIDDELGDDNVSGKKVAIPTAQFFSHAENKGIHALWAIACATGGTLYSAAEASIAVETPVAKGKRATARFRGTLDIGAEVRIPVKAFIMVAETLKESAIKLSWAASRAAGTPVGVHVETQRVASATDDAPLLPSQLVNAYAYGTDLVPEQNDTGDLAWSLSLPCGLSTIAFVPQTVVPSHWFMSSVCAVISMPEVKQARRAMDALVQALHDREKGILARFVSQLRGGAPVMAYLWPVVETSRDTGAVKNRYLCLTELPMREDVRDYPFSSLKWTAKNLPVLSECAMDDFIDSHMLDGVDGAAKEEDLLPDEDDEQAGPFDPLQYCNPALDRFYVSVIQRALDGAEGTELPDLTPWQKQLLDPANLITLKEKERTAESLKKLKSTLPVSKVPPKERTQKKVLEAALKGEEASIGDYLPPDTEVADEGGGENADDAIGPAIDEPEVPGYLTGVTSW